MIDEETVRSDITFGVDEDLDIRSLRERYKAALSLVRQANRYVDEYRAANERLAWECAEHRQRADKLRLMLDHVLTGAASKQGLA